MHRADVEEQRQGYMQFFGAYCADEADLDAFSGQALQQVGPRLPVR